MDASNPIPPSTDVPAPSAGGTGRAGPGARPQQAISEDDAARLIAGAPAATDHFAVLSRPGGRPMSEDEIAEFLYHASRPPMVELPPLPVARVAAVPREEAGPAPTLTYASRHDRDAHYSDPRLLAQLPVAFRVLRVAPWVLLALLMLLAMISSILR